MERLEQNLARTLKPPTKPRASRKKKPAPPALVEVKVTSAFYAEMRPWHEDRLADGETVEQLRCIRSGGRCVYERMKMTEVVAGDLLHFAECGADCWAAKGGCDNGGGALGRARMANIYVSALRSLRKQLGFKP